MALNDEDKQWIDGRLEVWERKLLVALRASPMARIGRHRDTVAELEDQLRHQQALILQAQLDALTYRVQSLEDWKDGKA